MKSYELKSCVWEITLLCCFSCKYCGSKAGAKRENELSTSECLSIINQLSALGCQYVSLIGGEVFLRNDWKLIVKKMVQKNIQVSIITNGYLITEELIQEIIESGASSIAVSLDSVKAIHDKYRQADSFDHAIDAIKRLTEHSIPVAVISTLNKENVPYLEDFYKILKKFPLYAWQLQACTPMGNAGKNIPYRFDFQTVIKFVSDNVLDAPFSIGIADNIGYFSEKEGYIRGSKSGLAIYTGCQAGISSIGIDSVGNVRGCEALYDSRFIEGNLRTQSLNSIWNNPSAFRYNRDYSPELLTGNCAECHVNTLCKGGCRAYNYFVHNKLYESPSCINRKK